MNLSTLFAGVALVTIIAAVLWSVLPTGCGGNRSFLRGIIALAAPEPPGQLVALHISNGARVGKDLPTRVKLLNWGDNKILKKDPANPDAEPTEDVVRVGDKTLAALSVNQAKFGFDRIALDFDHNSLPGHPNFQKHPRKVAAYGVPEIVKDDGLYLRDIQYTPAGTEFAPEYYDLSPAPLLDANREVTFLHSTALCGQGAVVGLSYYNADFLAKSALSATGATNVSISTGMSADLKKLLCTLFGVGESVSEDDLLKAGQQYVADLAEDNGDGADTGAAGGKGKKKKAPEAMSLETLAANFETLSRDMILSDAMRDGKIVPASAKALPLADLRRIVGELPAGQVPLEQRTPERLAALSVTAPTTSEDSVRLTLGLSPEQWKKSKDLAA